MTSQKPHNVHLRQWWKKQRPCVLRHAQTSKHPCVLRQRASSSSSPEQNASALSDARAVRDRQLNELLGTLGMTGQTSSSSFCGSKGVCYDGDLASDIAVANLVVEDAKVVALPKNQDSSIRDSRLKQLEDEYLEQIAEMRSEMEKAQKFEQPTSCRSR